MKKFEIGTLGIDSGEEVLFSHFQDNGAMWVGDGQREVRIAVVFSERFNAEPVVNVAVSMFDASKGANIRFEIRPEKVTPKGFDIVFRTWGDSKFARARASWQAIGTLSTEEVWDI